MRRKARPATLRGATWSALDKIMISPLVSKVKRSNNLTVLKLTAANCDQNHADCWPHTRVHQTLKVIDTPHQRLAFTGRNSSRCCVCRDGRLCDEKVAHFP